MLTLIVENEKGGNKMEYSYPFSTDWSTEEIVDVVGFFQMIEQAYESGVKREKVLDCYRKFNKIVPAKSEEKTYFREFEEASGYACFPVIRDAKNGKEGCIVKGQSSKKYK